MVFLKKLFSYEYVTDEHLIGLDKYKYSCVDSSPLSRYVMHPFWDAIVKIYPKWLAPNLLTFVGFLCLVAEFILFSIYDYNFYGWCSNQNDCKTEEGLLNLTQRQRYFQDNLVSGEFKRGIVPSNICSCIPRWLWLVLSICQFLSHHLDGTDGKQARRTGSSSPLGELFDHGLDSWATLFLPVAIFSIFGRSEPYGATVFRLYGILWLIMGSFIISHWEKYNTGTLFLPWSYDLSQVGMTFWFFVTYFVGQDFWFLQVPFLNNITLSRLIEISIYVFSLGLSLPFSIYNMYIALANGRLKQKSLYEAIRPLFPTIYLFLIQLIWIKYSKEDILELEPRPFLWLTGTLFSNIACRLIVAQMTNTRCQIFNWTLIPLTIIVSLFSFDFSLIGFEKFSSTYLTKADEINSLYFMAILVTLSHIHYGICMVRQICNHLNIYCFIITSKPSSKENKRKL